MKNQIRQILKTCIRDIRETRSNRSVPCLMGCGFTIAIKGRTQTIQKNDQGYSFFGMWNRGAIYWKQETAIAGMNELQGSVPFDLEVIHYNEIRDRTKKPPVKWFARYSKAEPSPTPPPRRGFNSRATPTMKLTEMINTVVQIV